MFRTAAWMAIGICAAWVWPDSAAVAQRNPPDEDKLDLYGDPLPPGALARLGTIRYRLGSRLSGLAFLPDSTNCLAATEGHRIVFFNARSGQAFREILVDPLQIRGFALSPDGRLIAVAGFWRTDGGTTQGQMRVIDVASGAIVRSFARDARAVDHASLAFTPDGKLLASLGTDGILRIEEVATGTELLQQLFPRDNHPRLTLSQDGKVFGVSPGPNSRQLYTWRWQDGVEPVEMKAPRELRGGGQLAFTSDGSLIAYAGTLDEPIHVWEVATGKLIERLRLPDAKEHFNGAIAFSPDGARLVAACGYRNGSVHVWNAKTWQHERKIDVTGRHVAISPDSGLLAADERVVDLKTGEILGIQDGAHEAHIGHVAVTSQGQVFTTGDDNTIRAWDAATGKQTLRLPHGHWEHGFAVSPDGTRLASSGMDDFVRLWDLKTGEELFRLAGHGRLGGRRPVVFTDEGSRFATFGDGDFFLRVWDVRRGKALLEHKIRPTGFPVREDETDQDPPDDFGPYLERAGFTPDGKLLVLCGAKKIYVFSVLTGRELQVLDHTGGHMISLAFSPDSQQMLISAWGEPRILVLPDGRQAVSQEKNQVAWLWSLGAGKVLQSFPLPEGGAGPVAFSRDGKRLAVVSGRDAWQISLHTVRGEHLGSIENLPSAPRALAFGLNDETLISGHADSTGLIWDLKQFLQKP